MPVTVLLACRCLWLEKRIGDLLYEDSLPDRAVKALKERLSKPGVIAPSARAKASPQELPE